MRVASTPSRPNDATSARLPLSSCTRMWPACPSDLCPASRSLFREMRRVRARIYRLLDGNLRPADQADLYFLLGCLSDLMAVAASGLGYPQAAEELIRSG